MEKSTNDGLVALIVVLDHAGADRPIKRGVLVGLGAAAKFFPAVLLPLVAVGRGDGEQRTVRKVLAAFVIAAGASIALFLPPGGLKEIWDHTIGFQLTRTDIFSIWALHPALAPIKVAVEAFAVILAVAGRVPPARRADAGPGGGARRRGDDRRPAAGAPLVLPVHRVVPAARPGRRARRRRRPPASEHRGARSTGRVEAGRAGSTALAGAA